MNRYTFTGNTLTITKQRAFVEETHVLHQIKAIKDFVAYDGLLGKEVKKGKLGGWIEAESNLPQDGVGWVEEDCQVMNGACVKGLVAENSIIDGPILIEEDTVVEQSTIQGECYIRDSFIHQSTVTNATTVHSSIHCANVQNANIYQTDIEEDQGYFAIQIGDENFTYTKANDTWRVHYHAPNKYTEYGLVEKDSKELTMDVCYTNSDLVRMGYASFVNLTQANVETMRTKMINRVFNEHHA